MTRDAARNLFMTGKKRSFSKIAEAAKVLDAKLAPMDTSGRRRRWSVVLRNCVRAVVFAEPPYKTATVLIGWLTLRRDKKKVVPNA